MERVEKWVAIDLGATEIKVSVLNKLNMPVRLNYPVDGYYTTHLSTEAVVCDAQGELVVGDDAMWLGRLNPEMFVDDWLHPINEEQRVRKRKILEMFLNIIFNAARMHYETSSIGMVALYDRSIDEDIVEVGERIFSKVKSISSVKAFMDTIPSMKCGLTVIADFGGNAFKVSIIENGELKSFVANPKLGFSSLDMDFLIDYSKAEILSNVERLLLSIIFQKMKIALNIGRDFVWPLLGKGVESNKLRNQYEECMTNFLYQCFGECMNTLQLSSKTWGDVNHIVFCGGAANNNMIDSVFEQYMQGQGCVLKSYNVTNTRFDALYAAAYCAIQMSWLREFGKVIVKR